MANVLEPHPQFIKMTEAEVLAALDDHNPDNPVALEVTRLIAGYTENFRRHVERLGHFPSDILRMKPRSGIEAVAMNFTTDQIRNSVAVAAMRGDATEH